MLKHVLLFLLLPLLAHAQLMEFGVMEMPRPDVAVVQANKDFPEDALLLVYSSIRELNFRSSLDAIDKVSFNPSANRYEILVRPLKQMVFVYGSGFMEMKIATINPNPKDVLYFKVEEKKQVVVSTEPGMLRITTEPTGADIFINGIKTADKTPFTGELPAQAYSLTIRKQDFNPFDTLVAVQSGQLVLLDLKLTKQQGQFSISSTPEGAQVFLNGQYKGITPLKGSLEVGQYEVEVKLEGYTASKETLKVQSTTASQLNLAMRDLSAIVFGQEYGGGVVFEIREDGHGLVVAMQDQSSRANWAEAKKLCEAYNGSGFTDWYLPSKSELETLYNNRQKVNDALNAIGGNEIVGSYYWSRREICRTFGRM